MNHNLSLDIATNTVGTFVPLPPHKVLAVHYGATRAMQRGGGGGERYVPARGSCRPSPSGSRLLREREKNNNHPLPTSTQSRIPHLHPPPPPPNPSHELFQIMQSWRPLTQLPRLLRPASIRHGSSASSERWTARATRDPYRRKAILDGYMSRAAFKLATMNDKHNFFKAGMTVVDLVCSFFFCPVLFFSSSI